MVVAVMMMIPVFRKFHHIQLYGRRARVNARLCRRVLFFAHTPSFAWRAGAMAFAQFLKAKLDYISKIPKHPPRRVSREDEEAEQRVVGEYDGKAAKREGQHGGGHLHDEHDPRMWRLRR